MGKKLLLSVSVLTITLQQHLPEGSGVKRQLPRWLESFMTFAALFLQRLRQMSCRDGEADPEMRSAQHTTLGSLGWSCSQTTLRCMEIKHFLWSLRIVGDTLNFLSCCRWYSQVIKEYVPYRTYQPATPEQVVKWSQLILHPCRPRLSGY